MQSKIKKSDKIVARWVGPNAVRHFKIEVMDGDPPKFSLQYRNHGVRIWVITYRPLSEIKKGLQRFAQTNSIVKAFPDVVQEAFASLHRVPQLDPAYLNSALQRWCDHCHGLKKGRVVRSDMDGPKYFAAESGHAVTGAVVNLCGCDDCEVEVVQGRYFLVDDGKFAPVRLAVRGDDGRMVAGDETSMSPGGTLIDLGLCNGLAEAQRAAERRFPDRK
ncbi:MAG: hypothetical protein HKM24_04540 [Gammaproteobacteria bacterium]|nr:hypothetical protein [Gammaproteobacteria bacterium]